MYSHLYIIMLCCLFKINSFAFCEKYEKVNTLWDNVSLTVVKYPFSTTDQGHITRQIVHRPVRTWKIHLSHLDCILAMCAKFHFDGWKTVDDVCSTVLTQTTWQPTNQPTVWWFIYTFFKLLFAFINMWQWSDFLHPQQTLNVKH